MVLCFYEERRLFIFVEEIIFSIHTVITLTRSKKFSLDEADKIKLAVYLVFKHHSYLQSEIIRNANEKILELLINSLLLIRLCVKNLCTSLFLLILHYFVASRKVSSSEHHSIYLLIH